MSQAHGAESTASLKASILAGSFKIGDESSHPGDYSGSYLEKSGFSIPHGYGEKKVSGEEGWIYKGQFVRGMRHGEGTCDYADGLK